MVDTLSQNLDLITPTEAAEILGVTRQSVDLMINTGKLAVADTIGPQNIRLLDRAQVVALRRARQKASS